MACHPICLCGRRVPPRGSPALITLFSDPVSGFAIQMAQGRAIPSRAQPGPLRGREAGTHSLHPGPCTVLWADEATFVHVLIGRDRE